MKPVTKVGDRLLPFQLPVGNKRLSIETEEIKTMITELVFYVGLLSVALYIYSISKWSGLLL